MNITQSYWHAVIIADTSVNNSLSYYSIPLITRGIVLVISPAIALMEDQVD